MKVAVDVRIAGSQDLPAIVRIYNQAVEEQASADLDPVSLEERRAWLDCHIEGRRGDVPLCGVCEFWGVPTG